MRNRDYAVKLNAGFKDAAKYPRLRLEIIRF